jgi:hypothetical protein
MRLSPPDNVAVALRPLKAGEVVTLDVVTLTLPRAIAVGHKFAARAIVEGELVVKYGCPIGTAMRAIVPGEPVHTHNMKSDYSPPLILAT